MAFKINVSGNTFNGVGTAVSVPHDADAELDFTDNNLINCKSAIVQRDPKGLVQELGLPADTPIEDILAVLRTLQAMNGATHEDKVESVKQSKLWAFIERSANVTSVIQGLVALGGMAVGFPAAF
ncbi:hypothetical protein [Pseudomonas sp. MWU13-3659]|uniref:hypothetical protein n=1 Tax=Pseudomonas sp. MWU13-3659 TaxID=2986964 RepID=UPI00207547A4|nr:hypothetical protein [Pseudomonas sp. MWU13-3659]